MNRREVVAITVIINIVLLSVLFFTAQRLEEDSFDHIVAAANSSQTATLPAEEVVSLPQTPAPVPLTAQSDVPVDEVDSFLRDFAAAVAAQQQQQQPIPQPQPVQRYSEPAPQPPMRQTPIATQTVPTIPSSNMVDVVVKKGDFLQKIAKQNHSTVEAIKMANNMRNDQLKVGQVLRVPYIASAAAEKPATVQTIPQGNTYKVKSGDSPWKIAKQHNVSIDEILRLNNLDEESAKNLKPGDTIRVP